MPVIYPIRDAPDAFEASVHRQDGAGQLTNELVATVKPVQLLYEPEVSTSILLIRGMAHTPEVICYTYR